MMGGFRVSRVVGESEPKPPSAARSIPKLRVLRTTAPSSPAVFGPCVLIRKNPFIGG